MAAVKIRKFWHELRRRKVVRVAIAYGVVAWVAVEAASVVFPGLLLPEWSTRLVLALALIGFPIALVLAWAYEISPDGVRRDPSDSVTDARTSAPSVSAERSPNAAEETEASRPSIAVLPMMNMSGDPENEYFSDGISEEIINLLARLPDLRVVSRTSSFSFKGTGLDLRSIATKLGVNVTIRTSTACAMIHDSSRSLTGCLPSQSGPGRCPAEVRKSLVILPSVTSTTRHRKGATGALQILVELRTLSHCIIL